MRKFLLFFVCVGWIIIASAQSKANFTISTTGASNLKIIIGGKKYSLQDRSVTFQSLAPGTYVVQIFQWQVKNGDGRYEKVFNGDVKLSAGKHLELIVMRFGKTSLDEGDIINDPWNEYLINPQESESENTGDRRRNNRIATDEQYSSIKKAISNEYYDDDKIRMAKVVLKDIYLNANQIKELVNLLYYDEKKLILAKNAYDFCSEKSMYFKVAEALYYDSNKKALLDYIASK